MGTLADSIRRGLEQAVADVEGTADEKEYRNHIPAEVDVKSIRTRLNITQAEIAGRFGLSVHSLRHWRNGSRRPEAVSKALSKV